MPEPAPRRVLLVCGTSSGGVGTHVQTCARQLASHGHAVRVAAPAETGRQFRFAETGAASRVVEISDRVQPGRDARAVGRLRRLAAGADVVHAHGLRSGALAVLALTGPALSGAPGPALVVTLHNAAPTGTLSRVVYGALERLVSARADVVLAVSADLVERMSRLGARDVEPALVPARRARPPARSRVDVRTELGTGDRPLLLTVARLAGQKGLPVLLRASLAWAGLRPVPLLVVAGDGPLRAALAAAVEADGLPVRLLGRREDVPDLLAAADVFVLASRWEGQPLVLQEALRAGVPIVATDVGGVRAVVGDAAVLVPAGDAAALAEAVEVLLRDAPRRERLARAALERARHLPGEADVLVQLERTYARACRRNRAGLNGRDG